MFSFSFLATGEGRQVSKSGLTVRQSFLLKGEIMQYENLNHLWWATLKQIMKHGDELDSRAGQTKEILGFQATLTNPLNNILLGFRSRKFSLSYACAEMLWYLSGVGKIKMIEAYAPSYKNFAENGIAYGAYGKRWKNSPGFVKENTVFFHPNGNDQLEAVIHLLKEKPNTRQAIMTCWDSGDLLHAIIGDHKDLPCTVSLKFYVRNGKLHLIADMRSNDAWLGLPYDVFCFTTLQRIVAAECKLQLGTYIHQAGSEHIYEKNYEKIGEILKWYWGAGMPINQSLMEGCPSDNHRFSLQHNTNQALNFEKQLRKNGSSYNNFGVHLEESLYPMDNLYSDLVTGCATKWCGVHQEHFYSPLFQEWQKQNLEKLCQ